MHWAFFKPSILNTLETQCRDIVPVKPLGQTSDRKRQLELIMHYVLVAGVQTAQHPLISESRDEDNSRRFGLVIGAFMHLGVIFRSFHYGV